MYLRLLPFLCGDDWSCFLKEVGKVTTIWSRGWINTIWNSKVFGVYLPGLWIHTFQRFLTWLFSFCSFGLALEVRLHMKSNILTVILHHFIGLSRSFQLSWLCFCSTRWTFVTDCIPTLFLHINQHVCCVDLPLVYLSLSCFTFEGDYCSE